MKITLEDARKIGKVFIRHERYYASRVKPTIVLVKNVCDQYDRMFTKYFSGNNVQPLFGPMTRHEAETQGFNHSQDVSCSGGITVVDIYGQDGTVYHGVSDCSPLDGYNKKRGVQIALGRALNSKS